MFQGLRRFIFRIGLLRHFILMYKMQTLISNCKMRSLMCVDLEAESLLKGKNLHYYWCKEIPLL